MVEHTVNRRNGDAAITKLHTKILALSHDVVCLKEQVKKYVPILEALEASQRLQAVIFRTAIVTATTVVVAGLVGFIGMSIWGEIKHLAGQ